jgi:hypothetical protein
VNGKKDDAGADSILGQLSHNLSALHPIQTSDSLPDREDFLNNT